MTLARGGSKGIRNKNIKKLNNKPLIYYTVKEALKSKLLTDYIISTDSLDISKIAQNYKVDVPFIRPKKYSTDKASSSSALKHAVLFMEKKNNIQYDFIIEIMATNPLKNTYDIDSVIQKLTRTKADSVIAMSKVIEEHPRRLKKIIKDKIVDIMYEKRESRRQDLKPEVFIRAGSIYGIKRNILIDKGLRYGTKNSRAYILPEERSINIDSKRDFIIAEYLIKKVI
ncbi:MAG: acylneuraminate cytidylyltransferase family protein [Alphaproteobacteria bacterium]|nr:acylneuraminate cytidylyltransferase family protein [Alphaproteobacteria bacterium]